MRSSRPKAYSYIRFSTPEQISGDSLRRQTQAAAEYAAVHNLELVQGCYDDLGISAYHGANAETGMLSKFIDAVRDKTIPRGSYLLIESMDRLSRAKPRRALRLLENICDEGITVVTLSDGKIYTEETLDDDPMAYMWAFMTAIRANEESAVKSRRMKAAWATKRTAVAEKVLTARIPCWLKLAGIRPDRRFEIIEERAAVVRRIYEMSLQGIGQNRIAEILNQEAVPPFDRARRWHASYMMRLLRSESVIGTYLTRVVEPIETNQKNVVPIGRIDGYYPAIVEFSTFDDVQTMRATKTESGTYVVRATSRNILAGLGRCIICGSTTALVTKHRKYRYIVCSRALTGKTCDYVSVSHALVETALLKDGQHWRPKLESKSPEQMGNVDCGSSHDAATSAIESRLRRLHLARQQGCIRALNAVLRMLMDRVVIDPGKCSLKLVWRHGATTTTHFHRDRRLLNTKSKLAGT
jgi:DNA invertase Pin-like site-specific DNA recombinase